ncbi:uncharacterized protein LOC118463498 isoform X1 [Anopheles albimanus]|uniref:uncharacterized protein LOC118463498 isoform X1 n=1 Tax=Anopheles albimanus TaxID=7167 RepID=UPI00163FFF76|nr:uncharacterized protein LOC118463498 isoform X1 [Anopheles albimanus]
MNKKLSPAAKFRRRLAAMHKKSNTTPGGRNRKQPKEQFFEHDIRFNADNSPPQVDLMDPPDSSTNPEPEMRHAAEEKSRRNSNEASSASDYEREPYPDRRIKSAVHRNDSVANPGVARLGSSSSFLRKNRRPNGLPTKHPRKTNGPSWNNRRLLLKLQQQLRLQGLCISSLVTMPATSSGTDPKRATADTGEAAGGCRHCHCACAISNPVSTTTGERLMAGHKHTTTCNDGDGWSKFNVIPRQHGAVRQPRVPLSCNVQPRPRGYLSEHPEQNSQASLSRSSSCDSIASSLTKESVALCQLREQYRSACSHSPSESSWQNRKLHLLNRHHKPYHHHHTHDHHEQEQLQQHKLCVQTAAATARATSGRSKSPALTPICMQAMHSVVSVRETHHIAQAQQEKNAKLRDAFGISQYFVEGTSFDQDRKAKEDLAKSEALQKELAEKEKAKELERANRKRYALVRTPSPEKERDKSADRNGAGKRERDNGQDDDDDDDDEGGHDTDGKIASKASRGKDEKKKKKKKARDTSSSPERKKEKKKKSKKSKKES